MRNVYTDVIEYLGGVLRTQMYVDANESVCVSLRVEEREREIIFYLNPIRFFHFFVHLYNNRPIFVKCVVVSNFHFRKRAWIAKELRIFAFTRVPVASLEVIEAARIYRQCTLTRGVGLESDCSVLTDRAACCTVQCYDVFHNTSQQVRCRKVAQRERDIPCAFRLVQWIRKPRYETDSRRISQW